MEEHNPYEAPEATPGEEPADLFGDDLGQLADRGTRLGAKILDGLVVMIPAFGIGLMGPVFGEAEGIIIGMTLLVLIVGVVGLNLHWLYKNGQTIGKRALDIKIVRSDRKREASLARILLGRGLPVWVLSAMPCLGNIFNIADALMIFREDRRCIHDHIADTVVVIDGTMPGVDGAFDQKYLEEDSALETFEQKLEGPDSSDREEEHASSDGFSQEW